MANINNCKNSAWLVSLVPGGREEHRPWERVIGNWFIILWQYKLVSNLFQAFSLLQNSVNNGKWKKRKKMGKKGEGGLIDWLIASGGSLPLTGLLMIEKNILLLINSHRTSQESNNIRRDWNTTRQISVSRLRSTCIRKRSSMSRNRLCWVYVNTIHQHWISIAFSVPIPLWQLPLEWKSCQPEACKRSTPWRNARHQ